MTENNEPLAQELSSPEMEAQGSGAADVSAQPDSANNPQEKSELQEIAELRESLAKAEAIAKDLQDRHLRLHAEFENYRRRTAREQMEFMETANAKLLEKLSEVLDNFDRAFAEENRTANPEAFEKGMQLIFEQFRKILMDAGLEIINPIGEEFDPVTQEAFLKQASDTVPENHVLSVFQKGYRLKNKILRTAKVIVSAGN